MNGPNPPARKKSSLFSELSEPVPPPVPKARARAPGPRRVSERELRQVVSDVRPDDGIDPKELARARHRPRNDEGQPLGQAHGQHRQEQFLEQVRDALDSALLAANSPLLNTLAVQALAKQGGSVVAVLSPRDPNDEVDPAAAAGEIHHASSMLTREVARAVTRKDAPHLRFEILPRRVGDES